MSEGSEPKPINKFTLANNAWETSSREVANEAAIALVFNGTTEAVMMASPTQLEDFIIGFAFAENIIENVQDVENIEIIAHPKGYEIRATLSHKTAQQFQRKRNLRLGPVGCGLCGVDSLDAALPEITRISQSPKFAPEAIIDGFKQMAQLQVLNQKTHAMHAAGFMDAAGNMTIVREDIGRHNALDKLIGSALRDGIDLAQGVILMSSRISVDLVQKCARAGCGVLAAVSAPSNLAIETAAQANIALFAIVRDDGLEQFCGW